MMVTQLGPCDSPGCSSQWALCFQQLPKSIHLRGKCGWPRPSAVDDLGSHTPVFPQCLPVLGICAQLPYTGSQCRGRPVCWSSPRPHTGQAVLLQAGNQAPREAAFRRTGGSRRIESLLSWGRASFSVSVSFPVGGSSSFPAARIICAPLRSLGKTSPSSPTYCER